MSDRKDWDDADDNESSVERKDDEWMQAWENNECDSDCGVNSMRKRSHNGDNVNNGGDNVHHADDNQGDNNVHNHADVPPPRYLTQQELAKLDERAKPVRVSIVQRDYRERQNILNAWDRAYKSWQIGMTRKTSDSRRYVSGCLMRVKLLEATMQIYEVEVGVAEWGPMAHIYVCGYSRSQTMDSLIDDLFQAVGYPCKFTVLDSVAVREYEEPQPRREFLLAFSPTM